MSKIVDKIKNYNQIILAIAGTVCLAILLISALFSLVDFVGNWSYDSHKEDGILATEETNQLNKDSLRKQLISFSTIEIIDSVNQIFVIPVTQANLDNEERYDDMTQNKFSGKSHSMSYYSRTYNNLVVYNAVTKSSEIIFENRLSISDYFVYLFEGKEYIVITATTLDSNKDGLLNSDDFQQLFIYDLSKKKVFNLSESENYTTLNAFVPAKSNQLLAHFGIDRNNNYKFDRSSEPKIYHTIDLTTMTTQELVNSDQLNTLQKLLEGR